VERRRCLLLISQFLSFSVPENEPTNEQLRERLRLAEESLRRSERLAIAGRFAGAIVHEVNNPLEALNNLIYLTKQAAQHPDQVRRNMQVAETQLSRLGEITRKTLSFYREQNEAKQFDLVEIAESALRIHAHRLTTGCVELRKDLPEQLMVKVMGGELLQVFSNFILNALDALPADDAVLCLRMRADKERVHITISDNGHGIHPSLRKSLFEPYVTNKSSGTGVGLWLSKRIVEKHQGTIRFRSRHKPGNSGTTFRVSLPRGMES
jgi:C4-dicarboxylate-specific signal transduction histidine kinase